MKFLFRWLTVALLLMPSFACRTGNRYDGGTLRIISLSPHITEIIYALEADSLLLAVTDFCRYPPHAVQKEQIGGLIDPNIEKIVALKPSHLFGVPAHAELNQKIGKFNLQIHMYPNETWDDLLNTIDSITVKIGLQQRGAALIRDLSEALDSVRTAVEDRKPGVLLLIGHEQGSLRNATVAGPNTFIDEMLRIAGGRNIYSDLGVRYGTVSIESMLARGPELIIDLRMDPERAVTRITADDAWSVLGSTPAVRQGRIYSISGNHTLIPGPRMLWLAQDFREVLDEAAGRRQ